MIKIQLLRPGRNDIDFGSRKRCATLTICINYTSHS